MSTTASDAGLVPPPAAGGGGGGVNQVHFLLDVARRFETEGNALEAAKSEETALLLRRALGDDGGSTVALFAEPLHKQAQALVLKCNSRAVEGFQRNEFDAALLLLNQALFLTEASSETNCFGSHEHDRLRLRAATFNNLGCLEKRRERLREALAFLQKAAELETVVDSDVGPSPSTNMNMCTVLNKLGKHLQAAAAAERAIATLKAEARQGLEHVPQFAAMMVMAQYNLGVSLEFAGRPGDVALAREAYAKAVDAARRYLDNPHENATVLAAERALQRLSSASQPSLPLIAARGGPAASQRSPAAAAAYTRPFGDSPMSSVYTPQPPREPGGGAAPRGPAPNRGLVSRSPALSSTGGGGSTVGGSSKQPARLSEAAAKHAERIQSRQRRKEAMKERDDRALKRAQQAHVREKHEKLRKERELEAQRRDEMARAMYEKMINGLRAAEIRSMKLAARTIQRHWRGYLVREFIRTMQSAVVKMQSAVRSWLCRHHLRIEREQARQRALEDAARRRKIAAAQVLQRHARIYIHRIHLVRDFRVRQMRRHASAKRVQRCYRNYRVRVERRILERIELERMRDQQRTERLHRAACRIQSMYRSFKSRRFMRVVKLEQARRAEAATKIQAQMRGALTRQWFRHYRAYRRQQELSTAANMREIMRIQRVWRMAVAKRVTRRIRLERHLRERTQLLFVSARRIQCTWRCAMARRAAGGRMADLRRRQAAARAIQARWRVFTCRRIYLWRRDEARKLVAIRKIQEWWRLLQISWKHQELARYHSAKRKQELLATIRTAAALQIQRCIAAVLSSWLSASLAIDFERRSRSALVIQCAGRRFLVQKDMRTHKRVAYLVDQQAKRTALFSKAARTIQRPVRMMLAKNRTAQLRRERVAAVVIEKTVRMHFAKCERRRRAKQRRDVLEHAAASKIQRSVRLFLKRQELRRLDAYYTERHRQKLLLMRREEAAITVQALWRGFATRQVTAAQRSRLLQNTIDAIRIQRAWRTHCFRRRISAEVERRVERKHRILSAATRIQCFWRRILAQEYVAFLREKRFLQTVACIQIQCSYRSHRARRTLQLLRTARRREQLLLAHRHDQWTTAVDCVNASVRTIVAQRWRLKALEEFYAASLEHRTRRELRRRHDAATRIQAAYRGFYERMYARGLRREKEALERAAQEEAVRKAAAAARIQRGWRCAAARGKVNQLRVEKRLAAAQQLLTAERAADPRDVVKQLFWSHEAILSRDIASDRRARNERQERAALTIQKAVRVFLARRRVQRLREEARQRAAAAVIKSQWHAHEARAAAQLAATQRRSATKIQALVRRFLVRLRWTAQRKTLYIERCAQARADERRDGAATTIQSAWRRLVAQRVADAIRERRWLEKVSRRQFESARMIQKHVRGHLVRLGVGALARPATNGSSVRAPRPPSDQRKGNTSGAPGARRRVSNPPYPSVPSMAPPRESK